MVDISDDLISKAFHAYQGAAYTGHASWPGISAAIAAVAPLILEEAAKTCEDMAAKVFHPTQTITDRCASAIRSLKEPHHDRA